MFEHFGQISLSEPLHLPFFKLGLGSSIPGLHSSKFFIIADSIYILITQVAFGRGQGFRSSSLEKMRIWK